MKLLALSSLFVGEAFCIWGEMILASQGRWSPLPLFMLVAGMAGLSAGYLYGTKYCGDIWVVCAVSTGSIVIVEPLLAYLYFNTVPEPRVLLGLIFGIVGLIITVR